MIPPTDPRVFFASERTLLAWLRTGIGVIGLGFLVARFGFFLALMRGTVGSERQWASSIIGVGLVLLGSLLVGVAAWQQKRFVASLGESDLPPRYFITLSVWMALLVAAFGLVLAVYLIFSTGNDHRPSERPASIGKTTEPQRPQSFLI